MTYKGTMYQPGDKVVVRRDLDFGMRFEYRRWPNGGHRTARSDVKAGIVKLAGQVVVVRSYDEKGASNCIEIYPVEVDENDRLFGDTDVKYVHQYWWTEEMFEGLASEVLSPDTRVDVNTDDLMGILEGACMA